MARNMATLENGDELIKELLKISSNAKKSVKGLNRAGLNVIKKRARSNARQLTGRGGQPIRGIVRLRSGFAVGSIVPAKGFGFLKFFEYGTKPGWRWARRKGPFRFFAGNRLIVTRLIKHPGMAKEPWLEPALVSEKDAAIEAIEAALQKAIFENKIAPEGSDG
jgi:hypothetical protein